MRDIDVLLVEDDPSLRVATEEAFRLEGLEVASCEDARSALAHVSAGFPGVVVSDIQLPGMDGMALLCKVKQANPDIPVILVTGHGTATVVAAAMALGARLVMEKPFDLQRLLAELRPALSQRRKALAKSEATKNRPPRA